jgi:chemotaxis protein MotB
MPKLKQELENALRQMNDFDKLRSHIEMTVTAEGLRIEMMESATGTFFDSGKAKLNADGSELLIKLGEELGKLPNKLSIEGHTDAKPYATSGNYGNWELSSDRANVARRRCKAKASGATRLRGSGGLPIRICALPTTPSIPPIAAFRSSCSTSSKKAMKSLIQYKMSLKGRCDSNTR